MMHYKYKNVHSVLFNSILFFLEPNSKSIQFKVLNILRQLLNLHSYNNGSRRADFSNSFLMFLCVLPSY